MLIPVLMAAQLFAVTALSAALAVETVSFDAGSPPVLRAYVTEGTPVPSDAGELDVAAQQAICGFLATHWRGFEIPTPVRYELFQWIEVEGATGYEPFLRSTGSLRECPLTAGQIG